MFQNHPKKVEENRLVQIWLGAKIWQPNIFSINSDTMHKKTDNTLAKLKQKIKLMRFCFGVKCTFLAI